MLRKIMSGKVVDIFGKRYDKLLVIKFDHMESAGKSMWLCRCDCGNYKIVSKNCLKNKGVRSCGCLLKERYIRLKIEKINQNIKPFGVAAFNSLYNSYIQRSKKKEIIFNLSKDDFQNLIKQSCYYCGVEPYHKWPKDAYSEKRKTNGQIFYNGIDRVNNNFGYTIDNYVPCCEICNKAKRDLDLGEFLEWIKRLKSFQKS